MSQPYITLIPDLPNHDLSVTGFLVALSNSDSFKKDMNVISFLKVLFMNHVSDEAALKKYASLFKGSSHQWQELKDNLIAFYNLSARKGYFKPLNKYKVSQVDYERLSANPTAKLFETKLMYQLYLSESEKLLKKIKPVSDRIIQSISTLKYTHQDLIAHYIKAVALADGILVGRCFNVKNIDNVVEILKENKQFFKIMYLHFEYCRTVLKKIKKPLFPNRNNQDSDYIKFCEQYDRKKNKTIHAAYVSKKYDPIQNHRARKSVELRFKSYLGIINTNDKVLLDIFKPAKESANTVVWSSEAFSANPQHNTYLDFMKQGIPYVSDYSGMTVLFLCLLSALNFLEDQLLVRSYLLAICIYMVLGGMHSIHEVLGSANLFGVYPKYDMTGRFSAFFQLVGINKHAEESWQFIRQYFSNSGYNATFLREKSKLINKYSCAASKIIVLSNIGFLDMYNIQLPDKNSAEGLMEQKKAALKKLIEQAAKALRTVRTEHELQAFKTDLKYQKARCYVWASDIEQKKILDEFEI